jgi:uncharacterized iron-regulated membrane protein
VNPWNGEVAQTRHPAMMNALQTITHIADPLHYGNLGGLFTKVIWFVFGLMLTMMSVSGFLIYSRRSLAGVRQTEKKPRRKKNRAAMTQPAGSIET